MTQITKIKYTALNNKTNSFSGKSNGIKAKNCKGSQAKSVSEIPSDKFGIYTADINLATNKNPYEVLLNDSIEYVIKEDKQLLSDDVFYIRMTEYGKNKEWASSVNLLTCVASMLISKDKSFEEILSVIEKEIASINHSDDFAYFYARRRQGTHVFPFNENHRGCEYMDRYLKKVESVRDIENDRYNKNQCAYHPKSNKEYEEANVCEIDYIFPYGLAIYQNPPQLNEVNNLDLAKTEFEKLRKIKNPTEEQINKSCATIQWLLAQETPYERGSDSITNVLTKAIYHAYDMKISPVKEGKSLDFEAFDTDLDDYIKIYPDLFETKPHKIKN